MLDHTGSTLRDAQIKDTDFIKLVHHTISTTWHERRHDIIYTFHVKHFSYAEYLIKYNEK
jgi:hypothetical protein